MPISTAWDLVGRSAGGAWSALPVLLSGAIFLTGITQIANTATALDVNLFSAVLVASSKIWS
jgi:hypothetical protein